MMRSTLLSLLLLTFTLLLSLHSTSAQSGIITPQLSDEAPASVIDTTPPEFQQPPRIQVAAPIEVRQSSLFKPDEFPSEPPQRQQRGDSDTIPVSSPGRYLHSSVVIGDKLYVYGGLSSYSAKYHNDLWMYSIGEKEWTQLQGDFFPSKSKLNSFGKVPGLPDAALPEKMRGGTQLSHPEDVPAPPPIEHIHKKPTVVEEQVNYDAIPANPLLPQKKRQRAVKFVNLLPIQTDHEMRQAEVRKLKEEEDERNAKKAEEEKQKQEKFFKDHPDRAPFIPNRPTEAELNAAKTREPIIPLPPVAASPHYVGPKSTEFAGRTNPLTNSHVSGPAAMQTEKLYNKPAGPASHETQKLFDPAAAHKQFTSQPWYKRAWESILRAPEHLISEGTKHHYNTHESRTTHDMAIDRMIQMKQHSAGSSEWKEAAKSILLETETTMNNDVMLQGRTTIKQRLNNKIKGRTAIRTRSVNVPNTQPYQAYNPLHPTAIDANAYHPHTVMDASTIATLPPTLPHAFTYPLHTGGGQMIAPIPGPYYAGSKETSLQKIAVHPEFLHNEKYYEDQRNINKNNWYYGKPFNPNTTVPVPEHFASNPEEQPIDFWSYDLNTQKWEPVQILKSTSQSASLKQDPKPQVVTQYDHGSAFPPSRRLHTAVELSGTMVVFGGVADNNVILGDLWMFKPETAEWIEASPSLKILPREGHSADTLATGTEMIVFGGVSYGFIPFNDLWIYSALQNVWTEVQVTGEKPPVRWMHTSCYYKTTNDILIFGGLTTHYVPLNDLWTMDLETSTWKRMIVNGVPPQQRMLHTSAIIHDFMYIFGGAVNNIPLDDCWLYDIVKNQWLEILPVGGYPFARSGASLSIVKPPVMNEDPDEVDSAQLVWSPPAEVPVTEQSFSNVGLEQETEAHDGDLNAINEIAAGGPSLRRGIPQRPTNRVRKRYKLDRYMILFGGAGVVEE